MEKIYPASILHLVYANIYLSVLPIVTLSSLSYITKIASLRSLNQTISNGRAHFAGKSKSKNQGLYYLYLEAVSVKNSKSQSVSEDFQVSNSETRDKMLFDFLAFSPKDLEFIVKFSEEHGPDIFRQIIHSLCPSIYGHELVKGNFCFKYH